MAQGRILKKSITTSERINELSDRAALLYTWLIPYQDDFGLIWASINKIKMVVVPGRSVFTKEVIKKCLLDIFAKNPPLIYMVKLEGRHWIWFPDFADKQILKKDRPPSTYLIGQYGWEKFDEIKDIAKIEVSEGIWKQMEDNGFQMEPNGIVIKDKLIKDNIREDIYSSLDFLKTISDDEITELKEKYQVSSIFIKARCEDVIDYCQAKGKVYKDYKAALRNFIKSHLEKHPEERRNQQLEEKERLLKEKTRQEEIAKEKELIEARKPENKVKREALLKEIRERVKKF